MIRAILIAAVILVGPFESAFAQARSPQAQSALRPPFSAPYHPPAGQDTYWAKPSSRERAYVRFRATLRDLRDQGLEWRRADGGTLTPEHKSIIQARLDEAHADYRNYRDAPW